MKYEHLAKTKRNEALLQDAYTMSLGQLEKKYNISKQRIGQITGGVTKLRQAIIPESMEPSTKVRVVIPCYICGEDIWVKPSEPRTICSKQECRNEFMRQIRSKK